MLARTSTGALHTEILTSSEPLPASTAEIETDGKVNGIKVTWDSDEPCGTTSTYSFSAQVTCDKMQTGTSNSIIQSVNKDDECHPVVFIAHETGCPISTGNELTKWLDNNPWVLAVVLLVSGTIIAFCGKAWFPNVAAVVTCLCVMSGIAHLAAHFGWLATSWSPWVILVAATILGFIAGGIVKRHVWFAVGLMGSVGGFFMGLLLFGLIAATTDFAENWAMIVFACVLAVVGGFLFFKWGQ